jgi:hypothetical protein
VSESLRRPGVTSTAADAAAVIGSTVDLALFRLAGGTALAWHLGHRLSEDLDFFSFTAGAVQDPDGTLAPAVREIADGHSVRAGEQTLHADIAGCSVSFFEIAGRWFDFHTPGLKPSPLGE